MEMMTNSTGLPPFFYLESLNISPSTTYLAIFMGTLTYCFIVAGNMTMILSITLNRSLHKPMYLLLLNLPVNDLMGATAVFPQLISNLATKERSISSAACFLQGLLAHLYGGGAYIILTGMAYDRFLAICWPLRYSTLMSYSNLLKIIILMWLADLVIVTILFCLLSRLRFCKNSLNALSCNNVSLLKLVCGDTHINNAYGLLLTIFLQGLSLATILFTYIQILLACLTNKQSDTKSKALCTCSTHLTVYMVFQVTTLFSMVSHRITQISLLPKRAIGIAIAAFPPILNPLIYGLNTKEIRSVAIHSFAKKKSASFNR